MKIVLEIIESWDNNEEKKYHKRENGFYGDYIEAIKIYKNVINR